MHRLESQLNRTLRHTLVLASIIVSGVSLGNTRKSVALVLSLPPSEVSIPMLEFYRATVDAVSASEYFVLAEDSKFVEVLKSRQDTHRSLGAIGYLDKKTFYKAHPYATSDAIGTKNPHKPQNGGLIIALQAALDTNALDAAIIVDCSALNPSKISPSLSVPKKIKANGPPPLLQSCGLYFYDRQTAKVTAQSRKQFRAAIKDARNWAPPLVSRLSHGMENAKTQAEKAEVEKALYRNSHEEDRSLFLIEVGGSGQSMNEPSNTISSLPLATIVIGKQMEGFSLGFTYEYGEASIKQNGIATNYKEDALGMHFGVGAKALSTLMWDLGMEASLAKRRLLKSYPAESAALSESFAVRSLKFAAGPGMLWEIDAGWAIGGQLRFLRYVPLSKESQGSSINQDFNKSSLSMGIRIRKTI